MEQSISSGVGAYDLETMGSVYFTVVCLSLLSSLSSLYINFENISSASAPAVCFYFIVVCLGIVSVVSSFRGIFRIYRQYLINLERAKFLSRPFPALAHLSTSYTLRAWIAFRDYAMEYKVRIISVCVCLCLSVSVSVSVCHCLSA